MDDIQGLKLRLVALQDRFIGRLTDTTNNYTEDALSESADMLSWAISSETILANLRVEKMMRTQPGKDCSDIMDTVSTIRNQVAETEERTKGETR